MAGIFCIQCGHANPSDASHCAACGAELILPGQPVTPRSESATRPLTSAERRALASEPDAGHLTEEAIRAVAQLPQGGALLIVVQGPNAGSRYVLESVLTTVGRHPDSHIFLDDVTVSRRHAEVNAGGGVYRIRDVGSLNGTYVNRERIEETELAGADEVRIGKFRLVFLTA